MPDPIFIDPQTEESIPPKPAPVAPSLTPMQQQFLGQLAAQPSATSVYQPAQSFNDPAYQQKLYEWEQEVRRTAEAARAEQAIQSGIRYIYQRRYDEDLKKGVPEPTAFSRMMLGIAMHGPKTDPIKAFEAFRQPPPPAITNISGVNVLRSGLRGERATLVPPPLPTGPIQGVPVLNPGGTTNQQYFAVPSATGRGFTTHPIKPEKPTISPSLDFQMLKTAIATTTKDLEEFSKDDPEYKPLKARLDSLKADLEGMRQKKPAGTSVTPAVPQTPMPLPKEKSALEKDKLYQTRRGVARWDGEQFIAQ